MSSLAQAKASARTAADAYVDANERNERARETFLRWRLDPVTMVREEFNAEPDPWQARALRAFPHNQRLAMKACKGPGKSALLSWIIWNFLATRPFPKVAVTSITGDNLKDGLWAELGKWRARSQFLKASFDYQKERIVFKQSSDNWFCSARQWSRSADAEQLEGTLAGLHADYILLVVDEVGGVPDAVLGAAEGALATGIECHLAIAGNPTVAEGPLWKAVMFERDLWHIVEVTGDPDDPDRSPRVSRDWALEQIRKYGKSSPFVQVNVYGRFPTNVSEGLVSVQAMLDAYGRTHAYMPTERGYERNQVGRPLSPDGPRVAGLDVARKGTSRNVFTFREGDFVREIYSWHSDDLTYTAGETARLYRELKLQKVYVDDIGVGGGVTDILDNTDDVVVEGINVSVPASDPECHVNLRSELAGTLQDRFRSGQIGIAPEIDKETELTTQATTLRFFFDTRTRRRLEDKDAYKKRTGESPDFYDSLALAYTDDAVAEGAGAAGEEAEIERDEIRTGTLEVNPWDRDGRLRLERDEIEDDDDDSGEWTPRRRRLRI